MSANLPTLYAQEYATNIAMLLQQKESRLSKAVTQGSYKGEQASPVDQVGAVEMLEVNERFTPMRRVDAATDRRWVVPTPYELPQLVDRFDKLKMVLDPQSALVQNGVAAVNRRKDRSIISAMFGTSLTGKTGSTSTTFPVASEVAVNFHAASNTGLTVEKLKEAKRILMSYEVDLDTDPLYCAVTATQHDNLLSEIQIQSRDFNDRPALVDGKIMRFMGFEFIHTELLTLSTYRLIPCWAKSGIHLGTWQDQQFNVSQRNDLTATPWQLYHSLMLGATRTEEKKVVKIFAAE